MLDTLVVTVLVAAALWYTVRRFLAARKGGGCGCGGCGDGNCAPGGKARNSCCSGNGRTL